MYVSSNCLNKALYLVGMKVLAKLVPLLCSTTANISRLPLPWIIKWMIYLLEALARLGSNWTSTCRRLPTTTWTRRTRTSGTKTVVHWSAKSSKRTREKPNLAITCLFSKREVTTNLPLLLHPCFPWIQQERKRKKEKGKQEKETPIHSLWT